MSADRSGDGQTVDVAAQHQSRPEDDAALGTILEALPYVARYRGVTLVIKLGGSVGDEGTLLEDLVQLYRLGVNPVLVHGGGAQISEWSNRVGLETRFVDGRRYTDAATLDLVRMVLIGLVNSEIVARLNASGVKAVGLSGLDGAMLKARLRDERLGLVGDVYQVDLEPLEALRRQGYVPVIAPLGTGSGGQALNVNADTVAGEIARAIGAEKLILFTDVVGVLGPDGALIPEISLGDVPELMESGVIRGGMIPKVEACVRALGGVNRAHIIDGRTPHALIRELFTDRGVGTMIVRGE
jgi:acetylglutamate kinase